MAMSGVLYWNGQTINKQGRGRSVVKTLDFWLEGHRFKPQYYIVGPLSKALSLQLLQGIMK